MARPRKCRICGYRFRENEDICPECFTARDDDISCEQFGKDEHTHSAGFSTTESSDVYDEFKERSFVDEQRSEEAKDPIPSATYGGRQGTPPPTYAQQSYSRPGAQKSYSGGQSRQDKIDALRNARQSAQSQRNGYNPQNVYFGNGASGSSDPYSVPGPNGSRVYYTRNGQNQKKSNGSAIAVLVIVLLIAFFIPVIKGIVENYGTSSNKSRTKTTTTNKQYNFDISYSIPDISLPNVSVPDMSDFDPKQAVLMDNGYQLYARRIEVSGVIKPEELESYYTEDEIKTHRVEDGYLPEGYRELVLDISTVSVNIDDPSSPDIVPLGCYLDTIDSNGMRLCTSYIMGEHETGTQITNANFLIPADYSEFKLYVLVNDSNGEAVHKVIPIKMRNITVLDDTEDDSTQAENDISSSSNKDKTA